MTTALPCRAAAVLAGLFVLLCAIPSAPAAPPEEVAAPSAAERDADWAAWLELFGKRSTGLKAHKEAMKELVTLADKYPGDYEIQWKAARAFYYFSERYQKEREDLGRAAKMSKRGAVYGQRARKIKPKGYDGRYWHLTNYVRVVAAESQIKAMREAKSVAEKAQALIADEPKRCEAYMILGGLFRVLPGFPVSFGDTKKALETLKKAEAQGGLTTECLIELAETYVALDDTEQAIAYYEKAAKASGYPEMGFEEEDAHTYSRKRIAELKK